MVLRIALAAFVPFVCQNFPVDWYQTQLQTTEKLPIDD